MQIYFQNPFGSYNLLKRTILLIVVCWMIPFSVYSQKGQKIRTVVIDAGHGGKDPGALGKHSKEKNITLDVALRTGKLIRQSLPDVNVIYTRSKDEFIELHRRASIANEADADIFISIHCNSGPSSAVSGSETFVMGEHKSEANLEVAKLENAAILLEENADSEYGGFDPNSTPAYIALNLFQSEYKQQSIELAQTMQEQFTKRAGRKDRSVQQAGFLVLYRTTMPSILVELGFISNATEEAFLLSEEGKTFMSQCIFRAFKDFKINFERDNSTISRSLPEETPAVTKEEKAPPQKDKPVAKENVSKPVETKNSDKQKLVYKVQFYTCPKEIPLSDKRFAQIEQLGVYFHNGLYKFTSGSFTNLNQATNRQSQLRNVGYSDAFVCAFYDGERISIEEALKIKK